MALSLKRAYARLRYTSYKVEPYTVDQLTDRLRTAHHLHVTRKP